MAWTCAARWAIAPRSDVHAVLGKDGASLIGEAAARRGRGENYDGGDAREARSIAGSGNCVHVEESGTARNQDKVGRPRGRKSSGLGMGRCIQDRSGRAVVARGGKGIGQARSVGGGDSGIFRFPDVRQGGGGGLWIEVDDDDGLRGFLEGDGEVKRQGGFPRTSFLRDEGDGAHGLSIHACRQARERCRSARPPLRKRRCSGSCLGADGHAPEVFYSSTGIARGFNANGTRTTS